MPTAKAPATPAAPHKPGGQARDACRHGVPLRMRARPRTAAALGANGTWVRKGRGQVLRHVRNVARSRSPALRARSLRHLAALSTPPPTCFRLTLQPVSGRPVPGSTSSASGRAHGAGRNASTAARCVDGWIRCAGPAPRSNRRAAHSRTHPHAPTPTSAHTSCRPTCDASVVVVPTLSRHHARSVHR